MVTFIRTFYTALYLKRAKIYKNILHIIYEIYPYQKVMSLQILEITVYF